MLQLVDLENSFLDVHAALTWLQSQDGVDANRVAVVGSGSGGNIAYVSLGVFPEQIKTGISPLSRALGGCFIDSLGCRRRYQSL